MRALGSRHSFNDIADAADLVTLAGPSADIVLDRDAAHRLLRRGRRLRRVGRRARRAQGMALHNLASLPHISVAGAVATATHGSGDAQRQPRHGGRRPGDGHLERRGRQGRARRRRTSTACVVGLGALGVVTRLTLDVEPAYEVRQRVFEELAWDVLFEQLDAITGAGYSVSLFTRWGDDGRPGVGQEPRDRRAGGRRDDCSAPAPATVDRHPIPASTRSTARAQLGRPGSWSDRLPHFRMGFIPSSGEELQTRVPRAARARRRRDRRPYAPSRAASAPLLQVSEIRTVAADRLWMSPQYGRDTVGLHFSWTLEPEAVPAGARRARGRRSRPSPRARTGASCSSPTRATIATLYERLPDFPRLAAQHDPRGAFRNDWLEARVLGGSR